ncbi:NAD(P)/FAD-dependent oxidoreductase [Virgibacillus doumboii]|uniref:NAD(P)/FAD-dependent oxidoreductase n=1 Tax=Virgibacillus doumboii TaxID=2697503 RepID=UPI0013DE8AFC|nr:FAD-binding oxidoreductase [Virgibacillus doumboii]
MKKIIVIGSGILGASTAYYLAKSGTKVIIADRQDSGQATDAAAGIVAPWLSKRRNQAWYKLAKGGARIYQDLIQELAGDGETDTGYARVGAINLQTDDEKLIAMKEHAIKRREDAPEIGEITLLDQKQSKEMFPLLSDKYAALHISGAARVDGRALRNALLRAAVKHGTKITQGNARLLFEGTQITGVSINGEKIKADQVIAATGAWTSQLLKPLDMQFDVRAQRAQIVHLRMPGVTPENWPVVKPPINQYMLSFHDRIVVGATHENHVGFDNRVTAGGLKFILSNAIETAPALEDASIIETRVGFRPMTPESVPVIGKLPGFDGLLLANGLGSSGLTTGPYVGKQLANLALDEELDIDLANYDMSRLIKPLN